MEDVHVSNAIGLDLGVKNLVVTSDGEKIESMPKLKTYERQLVKLNRRLAKSKKESKNREKIIIKIQRLNMKIKNSRKYTTHEITKRIVEENDLIVTETLKVKEMVETSKKTLRKHILHSSLSEIIRQLTYKAKWSGKKLVQIDEYYPSSQECNHCGYINKEVKDLSVRSWECPKCGNMLDRDINASINILFKGVEKYYKGIYAN